MTGKLLQVLKKISMGEKLTKVDLSNEGLTEFPMELLALSDTLEHLNMGGNSLSSLPQEITLFTKLRVLFFAQNKFLEIPSQLGSMSSLFMVSFKSNLVKTVAEDSLSPSISWLILTDNMIEELPTSIGHLKTLRKLMLAGNQLHSLPVELSYCKELELLRIAANNLTVLPTWLFDMPRLSWFAYAGNPIETHSNSSSSATAKELREVPYAEIVIGECIGEGASGFVHKAVWSRADSEPTPVAVKLFKGETTSDGLPVHEMETTEAIGEHSNFISVLGRLSGAPDGQLGLVLPLLDTAPGAYQILGQPPSFDTITRDTFLAGTLFTATFVYTVLRDIAAAAQHLHTAALRGRGIVHGDLYAHNILVHQASHHALLTDLGAASFKPSDSDASDGGDKAALSAEQSFRLEQIEVRAFGCLVDDLVAHMEGSSSSAQGVAVLPVPPHSTSLNHLHSELLGLRDQCWREIVADRPTFAQLSDQLSKVVV